MASAGPVRLLLQTPMQMSWASKKKDDGPAPAPCVFAAGPDGGVLPCHGITNAQLAQFAGGLDFGDGLDFGGGVEGITDDMGFLLSPRNPSQPQTLAAPALAQHQGSGGG